MTTPVAPPAAPTVPVYPALGSPNFNQEAYNYGSSMPGVASVIAQIGDAAYTNAVAANECAVAADASAAAAAVQADAAMGYRNTAQAAAATATTKASEADASAIAASKLNLGDKAAPPTTDNQGAALRAGATYYDTTLAQWRVWNGVAWVAGLSIDVANDIHTAAAKTTPDDADEFGFLDSAASWVLKKLTWVNLKSALADWFKSAGIVVPSINGGQLAGMRNKIINGGFSVNQRGYVSGSATTAGQYTLDYWKVTGTGGITYNTVENKVTVTIPPGQTLQQVIDGMDLQSGVHVLSWAGTAQARINGGAYGTSGNVSATITGGVSTTIEFNAGTVAEVQLELGTTPTIFERRSYGAEEVLCKRIYEFGKFEKRAYSQFGTSDRVRFTVTKRVPPSIIIANATDASTGTSGFYADEATTESFRAGADWTSTAAWRAASFDWFADAGQ